MINLLWQIAIAFAQIALLPLTLLLRALQDRRVGGEGKKEAYETFDHLALNVRRPSTEWLNMGHWQDTEDFAEACEQLARHLIRAADVRPGASILDVGHGNGDSLLLLLREFAPQTLHGVTSMRAQAKRAEQRVHRASKGQRTEWRVWCEEAIPFLERMASDPSNSVRYDVILGLDCVYHFTPSRQRFISACIKLLKPGGTIAMQDLIAAQPYPSPSLSVFQPSPTLPPPPPSDYGVPLLRRCKHAFVLWLSDTPSVNIIPADVYVAQLQAAGLEAIQVQDSSHLVFPGFAAFLQQLGKGQERAWRGGGTLQLFGLRMFGSVVQTWAQGGEEGMVRSVTTVARCRS